LRRAFNAGLKAAEQALIGSGGSDLVRYVSDSDLRQFFFFYLIEGKDFYRRLDGEAKDYWRALSNQRNANDPRIQPFCDGWLWFMEEEVIRTSPLLQTLSSGLPTELLHRRCLQSDYPEKVMRPEPKANGVGKPEIAAYPHLSRFPVTRQ
jgi:hypothetical protein